MIYILIFIKSFIKTLFGLITIALMMLFANLVLITFLLIRLFRSSTRND